MRTKCAALAVVIFCFCTLFGCNAAQEKEIHEGNSVYLQMDIDSLSEEAEWIVHGTVMAQGETFL